MTAVQDAPLSTAGPATPRHARRSSAFAASAVVVAAQLLVAADVHVPVLRPLVGLGALVGVPTLVLSRRVRWNVDLPLLTAAYALGVTLVGLLLGALAINEALPVAGVDRPLGRVVIVVCSTGADLALVRWRRDTALLPARGVRRLATAVWCARLGAAVALGALAVVLAVFGAIRLDNGLPGTVAVVAHAVEIAALALLVLRRNGSFGRDVATLYLVATGLLLGTSLRGWFITGHDVQREYITYLLTHAAEHWQMSSYPSPYSACLSVNILPSIVADSTGLDGVVVYKVVLQLLFAAVPVLVYLLGRRLTTARRAVLGTSLFVVFPTFFTDMPYLVRQEVAYLFVALALLVATETTWSRRLRLVLAFVMSVGVVLSHYSTTYVLLITLFVGMLGAQSGRVIARLRRSRTPARRPSPLPKQGGPLILLSPVLLAAVTLVTWLWVVPITDSSGHVVTTVKQTVSAFMSGNHLAGSSDLKYGPFAGTQQSAAHRLAQYERAVRRERAKVPARELVFPKPTRAVARPRLEPTRDVRLTTAGRVLVDLGIDVRSVNTVVRTGAAALFEIFLALGLLAAVSRRRWRRSVGPEILWLVVGSVVALGALVVLPGLSADYGVLRAFQQLLLLAAPVVAIGAVTAFGWLRTRAFAAAAVVMAVMGFSLTGVLPALVGGYPAQLSQSNSGVYYDLLYVGPQEVAAAGWLADVAHGTPVQAEIVSDKLAMSRLLANPGAGMQATGEFFPLQLRTGEFVFLDGDTVRHGRATIFYTGDLLTYRYPTAQLRRKLDLVFSNATAQVYR